VVLVVALVLARHLPTVADAVGGGVGVVAMATIVGSVVAGWCVGGPVRATRATTALVTGIRANIPALAIAETSFVGRAGVAAGIVTFGVLSLIIPLGLALVLRSRQSPVEVA
jgi:hypothetical protein